ncbi:toxin-antitoxin system YwqK family antitoxin [uncultured Cetobacterium sp.]|uniref:toxin-antitoxin system YwqK family antitoxin n=1 Tax=uncultured Cetobacterium sp. TaxID=527638 RepID=UPI00261143FC|nr:toxin-antitoxin system YwqK family antitoxin [uncultured Cetobacterium sp.]
MKKMNIGIGILLLTLVGCSSTEKKQEPLIKLPSVPKQTSVIKTISEEDFRPQSDIIHPSEGGGPEMSESGITEIKLNNIDQVSIAYKTVRNKIAYNGKSKAPFTGIFAAVIGVHKHYTEEYKDGKLNGNKTWYSESGTIGMIEPYKDGKKNGIQKTFYRITGKIRSKINYENGKVTGLVEWFDKNGDSIYQADLVNGTGPWITYWDNGKIKEKGQLFKGYPNGEWKEFTNEGQLEKIVRYRNGARVFQEWYQ